MLESDVGTIFALSWVITWYGHVLSDYRFIVRLFDFFVSSHPLMPVYVAAAMGKFLTLNKKFKLNTCIKNSLGAL